MLTLRTIKNAAVATVAAATITVAGLATSGSVDAAAVSYQTGAAAETIGACANGRLALDIGNQGFDYVQLYFYNGYTGQGTWSGWWTPLSNGYESAVHSVARGSATAVYAYYIDWNGYQWVAGGEWVVFNGNSYYCYG